MPHTNYYVIENDRSEFTTTVEEIVERHENNEMIMKQLRHSDLDDKLHKQTSEESKQGLCTEPHWLTRDEFNENVLGRDAYQLKHP